MTQDKRPLIVFVGPAGGECRLQDVDRAIEAINKLGVNPDRIAMWGKRTPLDSWSMPAAELRAVLETMIKAQRSPGEVDDR